MRALFPLLLAVGLAGCSGSDTEPLKHEVETLRGDLQKVQKENDRLASRLATAEQRINGLAADIPQAREMGSATASTAPAPSGEAAAAPADTAAAPAQIPGAPTIKAYLETDEGRKVLAAAITAEREEREREQQKRRVDAMVDRFSREASLSTDQSKKMKDILFRSQSQVRELWTALRDGGVGADATPEEREAQRQQMTAKSQELTQKTDEEVRNVLSTAQFAMYQQQQERLRSSMRGPGMGMPGPGGRRPNQNQ
jgi:hypothetical protein